MGLSLPDTINRDLPILVVDDVASARKVIAKILTNLGFTSIQEAVGIAEARTKLALLKSKLVIIDLHLKDGSAIDLVEEVSNPQEVKVIVITSDMNSDSLSKLTEAGVSFHLIKPFSPAALTEKILLALK